MKAIQEFEQIIQNKKSDIVWLNYYQGQIFQKFGERDQFVRDMVLKFNVRKSTIVFKIALKKIIEDFPRMKNCSLSILFLKKKKKNEIHQRNF